MPSDESPTLQSYCIVCETPTIEFGITPRDESIDQAQARVLRVLREDGWATDGNRVICPSCLYQDQGSAGA